MKIREISRYVVGTRLKLKGEKLTHQLNNTQFIYVLNNYKMKLLSSKS